MCSDPKCVTPVLRAQVDQLRDENLRLMDANALMISKLYALMREVRKVRIGELAEA